MKVEYINEMSWGKIYNFLKTFDGIYVKNEMNTKLFKDLYKGRHVIENFFAKIKNFRRIFSRFDKSSRNYLSFVSFAGAILWLR